jgi:hypothetical protein
VCLMRMRSTTSSPCSQGRPSKGYNKLHTKKHKIVQRPFGPTGCVGDTNDQLLIAVAVNSCRCRTADRVECQS